MNKHTLILNDFVIESHVKNALNEDIGFGDITTDSIVSKDIPERNCIVGKSPLQIIRSNVSWHA